MTKQTSAIGHTPGPWEISVEGNVWARQSRHAVVAKVGFNKLDCAEQNANARLIAAAPDLLAAVEYFLGQLAPEDAPAGSQCTIYSDALHPTSDDKTVVDYLMEAIAKAKGATKESEAE